MYPLLATTAISAVGNIVHSVAQTVANRTATTAQPAAPAVPFATLMDKTGVSAAAARINQVQDLSTKLSHSAEVTGAINAAGVAGPFNLQINAKGDVALSLPKGGLKAVSLSEEMRGAAQQLYELRQAGSASPNPTSTVTIPVA